MKLNKTTLITLFVTAFLVCVVLLYVSYNSASSAHKSAEADLATVQLALNTSNKLKTDLAAQLAQSGVDVANWNNKIALLQTEIGQASLSLNQTQSQFPTSAETIEYNETLMGLAKSSNLTVKLLVANEPTQGGLDSSGLKFNSNIFTISISGKVSDILDFVDKIATNASFKTAVMSPISFSIPLPLSQATKDQMRADIKTQLISAKDASITGAARVSLIEAGMLSMLAENSAQPSDEQMIQILRNKIAEKFSPYLADLLAGKITDAINKNLADTLVDTVAQVYSDAIGDLLKDKGSSLLPIFNGPLGVTITEAIQGIPDPAIRDTVRTVIADTLNAMVMDQITAKVSNSSIDAALASQVTLAEMPSAQLTVAVYSYKGE